MKRLMAAAAIAAIALTAGCTDKNFFSPVQELIEDPKAPKKCIDDPCDPGCPIKLCDEVPEPPDTGGGK